MSFVYLLVFSLHHLSFLSPISPRVLFLTFSLELFSLSAFFSFLCVLSLQYLFLLPFSVHSFYLRSLSVLSRCLSAFSSFSLLIRYCSSVAKSDPVGC